MSGACRRNSSAYTVISTSKDITLLFTPWLRFLRISALPSALADVFGGTALALAIIQPWVLVNPWPYLPWLLLATTGIYLGGMGLNDLLHAGKDRELNKKRPLVCGEIGFFPALGLTVSLYLAGLLGAALAGCFWPALALALLTACYNDLASSTRPGLGREAAGVAVLAACRALHVTLPLWVLASGHPLRADGAITTVLFVGSVFVYFALVTVVSLFEDRGGGLKVLWVVHFALLPTVLTLPVAHLFTRPATHPLTGGILALGVAAILIGGLHKVLRQARHELSPQSLGRVVGAGLRGECLLMACFALALAPQTPWWGLLALACYPVGKALSVVASPT